ncbi:pimeloyl-ACP methyl ester carboxylesterase [Bradyrhizobium sp. USDA 3364]
MSERRPAASTRDGVVLLHGISRTARSFRRMELALRALPPSISTMTAGASRSTCWPRTSTPRSIGSQSVDGSVNFVCHSMGGLLTRVYLARRRPARLGRVVMLGTPNGGSEIADRLKNLAAYRAYFGPAGQQLVIRRDAATSALLPPIDYPAGIIAGNRSVYPITSMGLPRPHDGRVSVANTRLDGMTDHIVIRTSHPWLVRNREAIAQTIAFLQDGKFSTNRQVD